MRMLKSKLFLSIMSFVMVLSVSLAKPVGALSEALEKLYSAYDILFYNAEQACEMGTTIPAVGGIGTPFTGGAESWNGACTALSASRADWLKKQISGMQAAASANGLPWEMIAGQALIESGGGRAEVCPYNPLGLKAKKGWPSCNGTFASFGSYREAYQYYIDSIIPIRAAKGKHPNDPYSAIAYIQYGTSPAYAVCDNIGYFANCVGHAGEPTPGYVQNTSSLICGVQKWAKANGIAISAVTWENYSAVKNGGGGDNSASNENNENNENDEDDSSDTANVDESDAFDDGTTYSSGALYCGAEGTYTDGEYEAPEAGNLADFVKKWAWPNYLGKGYTKKMPAYEEYINTKAAYKGGCNGVDCGAFVSNIMRASGWDPNYVQAGTISQRVYLAQHWNKVSPDSLQLGDVGIKIGHVILYVGNIPGFNSNTASASLCTRAPMAGADKNLAQYTWYRRR